KYTPKDEAEMFDIMNLLEERLRGSNSAVIVACSHVFLHLTQNLPTVHKQVFDRLREPLLTLMATSQSVEASYAILCHIKLLVQRDARAFVGAYKDFYCRHTDPTYIKCVKMDILTSIATETNSTDIVNELMAYVSDMNGDVSRLAITSMGAIALRVEGSAKTALTHFLDLLGMDVQHIRAQTLVVMKDFLRKYVDIEFVRPFLDTIVKSYQDMAFEDEDSRVAFAWVLGEFGEHIEDSPYLLLAMVQSFNTEPYQLRIELLTSSMKLFFKRPPEMQPVLASMFSQAINDFSHADVHDRALLYYRLLRHNPMAAAQVVTAPREVVTSFLEDQNSTECDKLFEEFNTLSVVYRLPSAQFLRSQVPADDEEEEEEEEDEEESEDEGAQLLSQALELSEDAAVEAPQFQGKWGKLPVASTLQVRFKSVPQTSAVEEHLEDFNIFTMAAGQQGTTTKMYLFSQPADNADAHFLVELQLQATGNVT
ncbi:MAG: hypothetical protein Q8J97_14795, partial [Flavobacteriaceae bacterium]|nr:hypothetical protein [Flavobacteriaceae bacterium]